MKERRRGGNQLINHNLVEDSISRSPITDAKVIKKYLLMTFVCLKALLL